MEKPKHSRKPLTKVSLSHTKDVSRFDVPCTAWLTALLLCLIQTIAYAQQETFDRANQAFEAKAFDQALEQYLEMIAKDPPNPAVHYNCGSAYFRQGMTGQAIYHLLMARALDPLDPDTEANLRFVRETAGLPSKGLLSKGSIWTRLMTLNQWAVICLFPFWTACLLKGAAMIMTDPPRLWSRWIRLSTWMTPPSLLLLIFLVFHTQATQLGVVLEEGVSLHASPFEDSKTLQPLKAGQEILLKEKKDDWQRIQTGDGSSGWLTLKSFASIPLR